MLAHPWRDLLLALVSAWNRSQLRYLLLAILAVWLLGVTGLYLCEHRVNPELSSWGSTLWQAWIILFSGVNVPLVTTAGRVIAMFLVLAGVALAGLFTAGIASLLVERYLRRREVTVFEMENHLVLCNWSHRGVGWIREVHSIVAQDRRPIVIIHDNPDDIDLPDKQDDPAFNDVYIVKGDPVNEVVLKRARVPEAHSVVVLVDERQGQHADGKTILICIAVRNVCRSGARPSVAVECHNPHFRSHLLKAGADEVISHAEFGLRLLARAALFHGMTRVYHELLTVRRDANEVFLVPVPPALVGRGFVEASELFLRRREY
jgi:voltage-gated potassium channel